MTIKGASAIKKYQNGGYFHEFTCGKCKTEKGYAKPLDPQEVHGDVVLTCKTCDWNQVVDSEWVQHIEKVVAEFPNGVLSSFLEDDTLKR